MRKRFTFTIITLLLWLGLGVICPPAARADYVGPTDIVIDGSFNDWVGNVYSQADGSNAGSTVGSANDISRAWYAMSTLTGSALASPANPIQGIYFRFDLAATSGINPKQAYWVQLNLGSAPIGMADHVLQIYVDTSATPKVAIILYQYLTPYPPIAVFTTGSIVAKVGNLSGFGVLDSNAVGAWGLNGSTYSFEIRLPISWYGSAYGGAVTPDGTGAGLIASAIFTSTGSIGSKGTPKDQLDDANGNLYYSQVSATQGSGPFVAGNPGGGAYSATASAATLAPVAGAANAITLTVKVESDGTSTDTSFTGAHAVTLTGLVPAPDGSYGGFNGVKLTNSTQTVTVNFASGVAAPQLELNGATDQSVGISIAGLTFAAANTLGITPIPAASHHLAFTTPAYVGPNSLTAGAASGTITVQRQDQFGNPNTSEAARTVTLASDSQGTTAFAPALPTIASGTSIVSFTYSDTKSGAPIIIASSPLLAPASQQEAVSAAAPSAYRISASGAVLAGTPNPLTITLVDRYGNTETTFSGDKTLTFSGLGVASDGTAPTVSDKAGAPIPLGTAELITFTNGVSSAGGLLLAYVPGAQTLGVSDSASPPLISSSPGGTGLSVSFANTPPAAIDHTVLRGTNTILEILQSSLLAGATDANHDVVSFQSVQSPSGDASVFTNGLYVFFLPGTTQSGATFTYTVSDGRGGTDTKTVTVNVFPIGVSVQGIVITNGVVQLTLTGVPGYSYDVERSPDVYFSNTVIITNATAPSGGIFPCVDPNPIYPNAFYRMIQH